MDGPDEGSQQQEASRAGAVKGGARRGRARKGEGSQGGQRRRQRPLPFLLPSLIAGFPSAASCVIVHKRYPDVPGGSGREGGREGRAGWLVVPAGRLEVRRGRRRRRHARARDQPNQPPARLRSTRRSAVRRIARLPQSTTIKQQQQQQKTVQGSTRLPALCPADASHGGLIHLFNGHCRSFSCLSARPLARRLSSPARLSPPRRPDLPPSKRSPAWPPAPFAPFASGRPSTSALPLDRPSHLLAKGGDNNLTPPPAAWSPRPSPSLQTERRYLSSWRVVLTL